MGRVEGVAGVDFDGVVSLDGDTDRVDAGLAVDFPAQLLLLRVAPGLNNPLLQQINPVPSVLRGTV